MSKETLMKHVLPRNKILIIVFLFLVFFPFQVKAFSIGQDLVEWELRVIVVKADIHLEPDENSTVVMSVPQSSILRSYEQEGEWYRVIFQHEIGIVVIGYIHSSQVKIIKEEIERKANFWGEESEFFEGIGLTIKVSAGFNHIAAGEINEGLRGIVDYYKSILSMWGQYFDREVEPFHSGFDYGIDAIYSLTPRIGIGVGTGYIWWGNKSWLPLSEPQFIRRLDSTVRVKAYPIRIGAHVSIPLFKRIDLAFNAGPAYYFVHYSYNMSYSPFSVVQKIKGQGWGFNGGIGLELRWNSRSSLFIEYQGRYAKFNTFKGTEERKNFVSRLQEEGALCCVEYTEGSEVKCQLQVLDEEMLIYPNMRKADFDLSGFAINVGAKVKF